MSTTVQNSGDELLAYAKEVGAYLDIVPDQHTKTSIQSFQTRLEEFLHKFRTERLKISPKAQKELESSARQIWNLCVQYTNAGEDKIRPVLPQCRLLSCFILEKSRLHVKKPNRLVDEVRYVSGLYLQLAEYCLDVSDLKDARLALCRMADILERGELGTDPALHYMRREQLIVRMALALREDRYDLANHLYNSLDTLSNDEPILLIKVKLCEVALRIGSRLFQQEDYKTAAVWLRRGTSKLADVPNTSLAPNQLVLKLASMELTAKAIISSKDPTTHKEAAELVTALRSALGDSSTVLRLEMDMLQYNPDFPNALGTATERIHVYLKVVKMGNKDIIAFIHCMSHIGISNPDLAVELLGEAIQTMSSSESHVGIGTMIIYLIDTIARMGIVGNHVKVIEQSLDACSKAEQHLKPAIVSRIRKLLWKRVGMAIGANRYDTVEDLCLIAEHPLLRGIIKDRCFFARQRLQARMEVSDPESICLLCHELLVHEQNDWVVYVQMVGVAVYLQDVSLCAAVIDAIARSNMKEGVDNVIYACVGEAIGLNLIEWFTTTFTVVTSGMVYAEPVWANITGLLQGAVRLAMRGRAFEEDTLQTVRLVIKIYSQAATCHRNGIVFSPAQVAWFRDTAYNLAIATYDASLAIELFECSYEFSYDSDSINIRLTRMHCDFAVCALASNSFKTAKQDDSDATSTICLEDLVSSYFFELESLGSALSGGARHDLYKKAGTLCMLRLQHLIAHDQWEPVPDLIKQAVKCKDATVLKAMGHCILTSGADASVTTPLLHRIINDIHTVEPIGAAKFSKYLRCLFQTALSADDEVALPLLEQAIRTAEEMHRIGSGFPGEELRWLVATSFNRAIDYWEQDNKTPCNIWSERALKLASHSGDGGALQTALEIRLKQLQIHNKEDNMEQIGV